MQEHMWSVAQNSRVFPDQSRCSISGSHLKQSITRLASDREGYLQWTAGTGGRKIVLWASRDCRIQSIGIWTTIWPVWRTTNLGELGYVPHRICHHHKMRHCTAARHKRRPAKRGYRYQPPSRGGCCFKHDISRQGCNTWIRRAGRRGCCCWRGS